MHLAHSTQFLSETPVIAQLKSLIVSASNPDTWGERVRPEFRDLSRTRLITRLAGSRRRVNNDEVASRTRAALKRLAVRYQ